MKTNLTIGVLMAKVKVYCDDCRMIFAMQFGGRI